MKVILCVFAIVASTFADFEIDWSKVLPAYVTIDPKVEATFNISKWKMDNRIVGGQEVEPNSLPYQVALLSRYAIFYYYCGGSLISQKYVLTAAHCIDKAREVNVILGAHKVQEKEPTQIRLRSKEYFHHPKWNRLTVQNDIGLVKLPKSVELTNKIQTIHLPSLSDVSNDFSGKTALISGWGKTSDQSGQSAVLRSVKAQVIKNIVCKKSLGHYITEKIVCTSGNGIVGGCNGDSGGPLVLDGKQIGIVSFGHGEGCEKGHPTAFTRVTSFLDWIQENSDVEIKE